jgi:hypothetical protein
MQTIEFGRAAQVVANSDLFIKTAPIGPDRELAELRLRQLEAYATQLDEEPVPVAPLLGASVVNQGGSFFVQHILQTVHGPNVMRLDNESRFHAVGGMLSRVNEMSTLGGSENLRVPIDSPVYNWHVNSREGDTPTLVDIYPPFVRPQGQLPGTHNSDDGWGKWFGTVSGVMTKILYTGAVGPRRDPDGAVALARRDRRAPARHHLVRGAAARRPAPHPEHADVYRCGSTGSGTGRLLANFRRGQRGEYRKAPGAGPILQGQLSHENFQPRFSRCPDAHGSERRRVDPLLEHPDSRISHRARGIYPGRGGPRQLRAGAGGDGRHRTRQRRRRRAVRDPEHLEGVRARPRVAARGD